MHPREVKTSVPVNLSTNDPCTSIPNRLETGRTAASERVKPRGLSTARSTTQQQKRAAAHTQVSHKDGVLSGRAVCRVCLVLSFQMDDPGGKTSEWMPVGNKGRNNQVGMASALTVMFYIVLEIFAYSHG